MRLSERNEKKQCLDFAPRSLSSSFGSVPPRFEHFEVKESKSWLTPTITVTYEHLFLRGKIINFVRGEVREYIYVIYL